jgi:type I restriction enzyme S subunit
VCSTDILVVRPKLPAWLGLVLGPVSSDEFVAHTDSSSTGTKMPRTNWTDMSRYSIALPPEPVAARLTDLIEPMLQKMHVNIHGARVVAAARDALLPKLLSGELRVLGAKRAFGKAMP